MASKEGQETGTPETSLEVTAAKAAAAAPSDGHVAKWRRLKGKQEASQDWVNRWASTLGVKERAKRDALAERLAASLPGAPDRPKNSYAFFAAEVGKEEGKGVPFAEKAKRASAKWAALEPAKRARYEEKAAAEKARAKGELDKFKESDAFRSLQADVDRFLRTNAALKAHQLPEVSLQELQKTRTAKAKAAKADAGTKRKSDHVKDALVMSLARKNKTSATKAPKPAQSAYSIFMAEVKEEEAAKGGGIVAMSKRIAERWSALGRPEREAYAEKAANDKKRYTEELEEFRSSEVYKELLEQAEEVMKHAVASPGAKPNFAKALKLAQASAKASAKASKKHEALLASVLRKAPQGGLEGVPKKPPEAFTLFTMEKRPEVAEEVSGFAEVTRKVAEMWKSASPEEKASFTSKSETRKREYESAMKQFRTSDAYKSFVSSFTKWQASGEKGQYWRWVAKQNKASALAAARAAKVAAKAATLAAARLAKAAAKAAAKSGKKLAEGAPELPKALEVDPFWGAISESTALDPDDLVHNDRLVLACARHGGDAALALLKFASEKAERVTSFFRPQSADRSETSLHYALLRGDRELMRLLAREHRRDGHAPEMVLPKAPGVAAGPNGEQAVAPGTKLWFWRQGGPGKNQLKYLDSPAVDPPPPAPQPAPSAQAAPGFLFGMPPATFGATAPSFGTPAFGTPPPGLAAGIATRPASFGTPTFGTAAPSFGRPAFAFGTTAPSFGTAAPAFGAFGTVAPPSEAAQTAPTASVFAAEDKDAKYVRHGECVTVEECKGEWIRATGAEGTGWLPLRVSGALQFSREDPEFCRRHPTAPSPELQPVSTGFASGRAYRAKKLRKVKLSRGGREGNQAFIRDITGQYSQPSFSDTALHWAAEQGVSLETILACCEFFGGTARCGVDPGQLLGDALRYGRLALARELVEKYLPSDLWGLNAVHKLAMKEAPSDEDLTEASKKKQSILKKAHENYEVSPLHCASIVPDVRMLEAMLEPLGAGAEDMTKDESQRTLLHYAAAAEAEAAVELLLAKRFSPHRIDKCGITPLMCACMADRPACVEKLLAAGADPFARAEEITSFHFAVRHGAVAALAALLKHTAAGAGKKTKGKKGGLTWEQALTSSKLNPLHEACAKGDQETVMTLITNSSGRCVHKPDKQGRTPLIWSVMNGHTKLASFLLSRGADVDQADTSGNRPLHYALAYGWREAAKLLIAWGHEPDVLNTWRTTPVDVAILKGHYGMAAWFLAKHEVNPDTRDQQGRTLLARACQLLSQAQWRAILRALVEGRGADVNLADGSGSLPICIAVHQCASATSLLPEVETSLKILCAAKADVSRRSEQGKLAGQSALSIALRGNNHKLLVMMLQGGAGVAVHGHGETLLHTVPERVITVKDELASTGTAVLKAMRDAVSKEVLAEMARTPNARGLLPLHAAVLHFNSVIVQVRQLKEQERQRMAKNVANTGFGMSASAVKSEEAVLQNLKNFVSWMKDNANANIDTPSGTLAQAWKPPEVPAGTPPEDAWKRVVVNKAGALGPMPSNPCDIIEKSVPAHNRELWTTYDQVFGLATPLTILVTGGCSIAVEWLLDELEGAGVLESCLSAANLYGVTPLVAGLERTMTPLGLSADTLRRLVTPKSVAVRLFDGRTPLHLAVTGGVQGWTTPLVTTTLGAQHTAPPEVGTATTATTGAATDTEKAAMLRQAIADIWKRFRPHQASRVDALLAKYAGRERSAYLMVCKKYGVPPTLLRPGLHIPSPRLPSPGQGLPIPGPPGTTPSGGLFGQPSTGLPSGGLFGQGKPLAPSAGGPFGSASPSAGFGTSLPSGGMLSASSPSLPSTGPSAEVDMAVTTEAKPMDPRVVVFEHILEAAATAGTADAVDGKGFTPLHRAISSGLQEPVELAPLVGASGGFAASVHAAAVARTADPTALAAPGDLVLSAGRLKFCNLESTESVEPFGLPWCRVSCGRWYFDLRNVHLENAQIGFADAQAATASDVARGHGLHWVSKRHPWPAGCTVGVALDVDSHEVWLCVNNTWEEQPALQGFSFESYLFPIIAGVGECVINLVETCRRGTTAGISHFRSLWRAAAAASSRQRMVGALLAVRACVNSVAESSGYTALQLAAQAFDAAVAQRLCDAGATADTKTASSGRTALHMVLQAMGNGVEAFTMALVAAKADVNLPDPVSGSGQLQAELYAQRRTYPHRPLHWAVSKGNNQLVELLLQARADANAPLEQQKLITHMQWLPLPSVKAKPLDSEQQEDPIVRGGSNVALEAEVALQTLSSLGGVDSLKLHSAISRVKFQEAGKPAPDVAVLAGVVARVVGDGTFELSGGDFSPLLEGRGADAPALVVPRSSLLMKMEVLSVSVSLLRPIHCAAERNEDGAVEALLRHRADPSILDELDGRLPLHSAVNHLNDNMVKYLIDAGSPLNVGDKQQTRPILGAAKAAISSRPSVLTALLDARAAINEPCSGDGASALHLAAAARCQPAMHLLLRRTADTSVKDSGGRTPLHLAVNAAAPSEPSFDVERQLLIAGAEVNALDNHNRTPLHYAFVKLANPLDPSFADPVETVTSLCAVEGVKVDIADEFGATPLLYAARRGATISSLYLAKRGVDLQARDEHSNDVLGTALAASHHEYAITLLSQDAGDVHSPMRYVHAAGSPGGARFREFQGVTTRQDLAARLQPGATGTVDFLLQGTYTAEWTFELLADSGEGACLGFVAMPPAGERIGSFDSSNWVCVQACSGKVYAAGESHLEESLKLCIGDKLTFRLDLAKGKLACSKNDDDKPEFTMETPSLASGMWRPAVQNAGRNKVDVSVSGCRLLTTYQADPPVSLFHVAITHKWLGLAYLLLDHGFTFHRAIQDSLSLGEFRLVLTLLSKINPSQNALVRGLDDEKRNLFHVLADFPQQLGNDALSIARELKERGVNAGVQDGRGRLPLHSATTNGHFQLASWLVKESGPGACMTKSANGLVPLNGASTLRWMQKFGQGNHSSFLGALLPGNRAAVCEPFMDEQVDSRARVDSKVDLVKPPVRIVPLVEAATAGFGSSAARILEMHADTNARDGYGETALGASLRHNSGGGLFSGSTQLVRLLLFNTADANLRDSRGNTPLRLAVRRSEDAVMLVEDLVKAGARVTDEAGTKPLDGSLIHDALHVQSTKKDPVPCVLVKLLELKADANMGRDASGRPPVMVTVDTKRLEVLQALLASGASPTCTDSAGRSPLVTAIQLREPSLVAALLGAEADPQEGCDKGGRSPLFGAVEWGYVDVVAALLTAKADANMAGVDEAGRAPLSFAVRANNGAVAATLLAASADPKAQDKAGRNAAHHCVQPLAYGSYENAAILVTILRAPSGREAIIMKDSAGVTPVQAAAAQGSGALSAALLSEGLTIPEGVHSRSKLSMAEEPTSAKPDIDADARAELERIEASAKPVPIAVHTAYGMAGANKVYTADGVEHDAMLFKVDLKRNEMRFYHLQLVYEEIKDLYVLFTRWGEIGETGAFQRTPLPGLPDALKEYSKVFKEKTGNVWATKDTDWEKKPGKYQLLKRRQAVTRDDEFLRKFSPDEAVTCSLPVTLQRTVAAICNPKVIKEALTHLGINSQSMPFGSLSRATLNEAKALLGEIRTANNELKEIMHSSASAADPMEVAKQRNNAREKILELSSRYYELVPRQAGSCEVARPLEGDSALAEEFQKLIDLVEASVGVQLLMGALHRQDEDHPLDYCLRGLRISLEEVDSASDEFAFLVKYAQSTCNSGSPPQRAVPSDFVTPGQQHRRVNRSHDTITAIYRLAREGETSRFVDGGAHALSNRRLLWHGSRLSNIIGILSQGLRVAPPEAPVSGYMFGKGVYFADMYSKSRAYARSGSSDTTYMILCEVALGEMFPAKAALYMDDAQPGTRSTWGMGACTPDWVNRIVEPGGAALPGPALGESAPRSQLSLNYNEFIVYDPAQIRMRYLIELNNFEFCMETMAPSKAPKRAKVTG